MRSKNKLPHQKIYESKENTAIKATIDYSAEKLPLTATWKIQVSLQYPANYQPIRPFLAYSDYQPLELIAAPLEKTVYNEKNQTWLRIFEYEFDAIQAGEYNLRAVSFYFENLVDNKQVSAEK